jgi:hypothetical protein
MQKTFIFANFLNIKAKFELQNMLIYREYIEAQAVKTTKNEKKNFGSGKERNP